MEDIDARSVGSEKSLDSDIDDVDASGVRADVADDDEGPRYIVRRRASMLAIVYLSVFIDVCGSSIIMPVIPFLARSFQASPFQIGFLYSGYALAQMVANVVGGRLSDRIGRRPLILAYLAGSAVGFLVQGFARSYGVYLFARLLTGLFSGSAPVVEALIADVTTRSERPKYLAMIGSVIGSAFLFGPGIGSGLAEFGMHTPMFVSSGVSFFGLTLALFLLREPAKLAAATAAAAGAVAQDDAQLRKPRAGSAADTAAAFLASSPFARVVPLVVLSKFCSVGSTTALFTMLGLLLQDKFGWGSRELGFIFTSASIAFITAQILLFAAVARRAGKHMAAVLGSLVLTVAIALLPLPDSPYLTFGPLLLHALGMALTMPAFPSLISRYSPAHMQGRMLGLAQAAAALSRVLLPPVLGWLYALDMRAPFMLCAMFAATSALLSGLALAWNKSIHTALLAQRRAAVVATAAGGSGVVRPNDEAAAASFAPSAGTTALLAEAGTAGEGLAREAGPSHSAVFGDAEDGVAAGGAGAGVAAAGTAAGGAGDSADAAALPAADRVEDAAPSYDAQLGRFLLGLLRRRGYDALAEPSRASRRRLRAVLRRAFPGAAEPRVRGASGAADDSADEGGDVDPDLGGAPGFVFVPDMFRDEDSRPEGIVMQVQA